MWCLKPPKVVCGNVRFVARLGRDPAVQSGQGSPDSLLGRKVQLLLPPPGPEGLLPGAFSPSAVLAGRAAPRGSGCWGAGVRFESQDVETNEKPKQMSQRRRKGALGSLRWKSVGLISGSCVGAPRWEPR